MKDFVELEFRSVSREALDETRAKFRRYWKDPEPHMDAINFALGLFSGVILRRLRGEPDPDPGRRKGFETAMTTPSPQLIILNEADGPGLRIVQYCPVCDENVTDSLFSADDFMSVDAAGMVGDFDAHAWLDHVAARHGGAS